MSLKNSIRRAKQGLVGILIGAGASIIPMGCVTPGTYESADGWATIGAAYDLSATNPDLDPKMRNLFRAGANYSAGQSARDFERARTERMARAAEEAARIRAQGEVDATGVRAGERQAQQQTLKQVIYKIDADGDGIYESVGIDRNKDDIIERVVYVGPMDRDAEVGLMIDENEIIIHKGSKLIKSIRY